MAKATRTNTLTPRDVNTLLRQAKTLPLVDVLTMRNTTFRALRRLRVARDKSLAVKGIPRGSDQVNMHSFVCWCDCICKDDAEAIEQLKKIDATCCARWE